MINKKINLYQRISKKPKLLSDLKKKVNDKNFSKNLKVKAIIGNQPVKFDPAIINEKFDSGNFDFGPVEEAIIEIFGRPVLEIKDGKIDTSEPDVDFWKDILDEKQKGIEHAIKSVGRIEVVGHPTFDWVGTGWLYKGDYIITNRHVAKEFAKRNGEDFVFKKSFWGNPYTCKIDFKEEFNNPVSEEYDIQKIVHIEPDSGLDIAVLKIKWHDNNKKFPSLLLADKTIVDKTVAIIGYPARDSRTNIPEEQLRIFTDIFNKKRLAVGEIDGIDPTNNFFIHDCTTLGGNSGSPVIDIETQKVYGLHFSGRERQGNFAITSQILCEKLDDVTKKTFLSTSSSISNDFEDLEKRVTIDDVKDLNGYNKDFLNKSVPFPKLSAKLKREVAKFGVTNKETELKYTNYSVVMSKKKRLALVTAVNIDGNKWRHIVRGSDSWKKDPRIDKKLQVGNELYKFNKFDRGHLVRRLDPAWGDSFKEAKVGSDNTFFYTNCAPQHEDLNQEVWLDLEDHILSNVKTHGMKVSVFNGPLFSDNDMHYRGVQIPESYWKVVIANSENNNLHSTAYLLSQEQWLDDLEFVFGEFRTFQVPISFIEEKTGLKFNKAVQESDPLKIDTESAFGFNINELKSVNNIKL